MPPDSYLVESAEVSPRATTLADRVLKQSFQIELFWFILYSEDDDRL